MATASREMISKLVQDAQAVEAALNNMKKTVENLNLARSRIPLKTVEERLKDLKPQVHKFTENAARRPAILAAEEDYKRARKTLTAIIKASGKLRKVVNREAAAVNKEPRVEVVAAAESEILVRDKKLAQALKMVARGDKGRSGPKEAGIEKFSHIHVGGNAKYNLLFRPEKKLVLGTLAFHMDCRNNASRKQKIKTVAKRGGAKFTIAIRGDEIVKV